jgi:nicotinate phosphoribosyltransferase
MNAALRTDHYELTMVQAALKAGTAQTPCVFEVFARSLPGRRRYGVVAGQGRLLELLPAFRFDDDALEFVAATRVVDAATCEWLSSYRFTGSIHAYAEGEAYFPGSPVLVVDGSFAECVVLETLILSILNHDSAIATAAARIVCAAGDRPCVEMGSRRTHEESAIAAARAAYLAGFESTSNLAAGQHWGIPTTGTAAHAFTLLHRDERTAFAAQVDSLGVGTTLLVDTFDVEQGIRTAIDVAGTQLGAIRLDSGDLVSQAKRARALLDELGATSTRIIVTSDLDEHSVAALAAAPVDAYGVGTSLVTGSGVPTAGFVYKLVARSVDGELRAVGKTAPGKHSVGGRKWASRRLVNGVAASEQVYIGALPPEARDDERPLLESYVLDGKVDATPALAEARQRFRESFAELPEDARKLSAGDPALETVYVNTES